MHGKERVIAPRLEAGLGVRCVTPAPGFDTDRFGTFAGDVPRRGSARATAREKALAGMAATGTDLAVASEGTFAPHPEAPLLPIGVELLLLVDRRDGLEIAGEDVTAATNHARAPCRDLAEARAFGGRIGFPDHGLVLTLGEPPRRVHRGLHDLPALAAAVADLQRAAAAEGLPWFAGSDMRADHNPTRMQAIDRAAAALATRAATRCPACELPGFGPVDVRRGLPCALCGLPTPWLLAVVHGCARCPERRELPRADGRQAADPGDCPVCNP
ncbi:MAG: hypothetical protein KF830_11230 [Planctomycetes bacterium]|nr:hypothetical protein [Planctomycetota bacterium]